MLSLFGLGSTSTLSRWLEQHEKVSWVSYPGLESHPSHQLAKRLFRPNLYGGVLSFGVKGDAKIGSQVVDTLKLASNLANVGMCNLCEIIEGSMFDFN